jgi:hypothetical protein
MKLKTLLSLILSLAFFVADAQQNNIPAEQQLYFDFNGNISDNSVNGLSAAVTNISFEADRSSSPLRAGRFGGCNSLSHIQVSGFNDQMDFATGGTIAMWAKPDLNNSMDPATGNCIANGRHTFFSKGGDGSNTPPGFYAYTSIDNGTQTIAFKSSSNSGNVDDSFTIPYTDAWHHYTFVFTTTNLKVYVDGVLKRDVAINLSFTEANNQTLYIGTLGPKSTPVNGITYWFPFGGLMDEFRLFTKALTAAEVEGIHQNVKVGGVAPNVNFFKELVSSSGFSSSSSSKIKVNNGEVIFTSSRGRGRSISSSSSLVKIDWYDNDIVIKSDTVISCSRSISSNHCEFYSGFFSEVRGNEQLLSLTLTGQNSQTRTVWIVDINTRSRLFSINSNSYGIPALIFFYNGNYYNVGTRWNGTTNGNDLVLSKFNGNGTFIQSATIQDANVNNYDWDGGGKLLIGGQESSYILNLNTFGYISTNVSAKNCKWVGDEFILSNDNNTFRSTSQFSLTSLTNDLRKIDLLTSGEYLLSTQTDIHKYGRNHILENNYIGIGNFEPIGLSNFYVRSGDFIKIYDSNFNLLWQYFTPSTNSCTLKQYEQHWYLIENSYSARKSTINQIALSGTLIWRKDISTLISNLEILANDEVSYISRFSESTGSGELQSNHFLTRLNSVDNPCDFGVSTSNIKNIYCSTSTYNPAYIQVGERIDSFGKLLGLPDDFDTFWEKDGSKIQENGVDSYQILISESGTYTATVVQGNCSKSISKTVAFSDIYNPSPPVLSVLNSEICQGDSASIFFSGCNGSVQWSPYLFDNNTGDNLVKFKPSSSGSYSATCFKASTLYGSCRSDASNSVNISVIAFPQAISLAGPSPLNATYRAERINSQQNVIINGAVDYKSINAIVLNPGFSTQGNAIFNAKIVSSCVE